MKSREDLLKEAREVIPEMSVQEVYEHLQNTEHAVLLDVRGLDEWEMGHLKGAVHISRGNLETEAEGKIPDKTKEVVVYCAGGIRSLLAGQRLKDLGFQHVISMSGGYDGWRKHACRWSIPPPLRNTVIWTTLNFWKPRSSTSRIWWQNGSDNLRVPAATRNKSGS